MIVVVVSSLARELVCDSRKDGKDWGTISSDGINSASNYQADQWFLFKSDVSWFTTKGGCKTSSNAPENRLSIAEGGTPIMLLLFYFIDDIINTKVDMQFAVAQESASKSPSAMSLIEHRFSHQLASISFYRTGWYFNS
jgi:hypothetical protein